MRQLPYCGGQTSTAILSALSQRVEAVLLGFVQQPVRTCALFQPNKNCKKLSSKSDRSESVNRVACGVGPTLWGPDYRLSRLRWPDGSISSLQYLFEGLLVRRKKNRGHVSRHVVSRPCEHRTGVNRPEFDIVPLITQETVDITSIYAP